MPSVKIFATINNDRKAAACKTVAYLARGGSTAGIFDAARRMIFHKGTDSHDYKYGGAIWEECLAASDPRRAPACRRGHVPFARLKNERQPPDDPPARRWRRSWARHKTAQRTVTGYVAVVSGPSPYPLPNGEREN